MIYKYEYISSSPDLTKIIEDVMASDMADKSIEWCRWDQDDLLIIVVFVNELSEYDKIKLDLIVSLI